jgi:autotransporter-associated beta strand protein
MQKTQGLSARWLDSLLAGSLLFLAANGAQAAAGTVVAWGYNLYGETNVPQGLTGVSTISAGAYHSVALESNGTIVAWGYDDDFETNVPPGLTNVSVISAGDYFTLALQTNGVVSGWGSDVDGQTSPPPGLLPATAIAAGGYHGLVLQSNGTVAAWGLNSDQETNVPAGLSNVVAIAAGDYHSIALRNDGSLVDWGELTAPPGLTNMVAVAGGVDFGLALEQNGTVTGWGFGVDGQTGPPPDLTNAVAIAAGGYYGLALRTDGTVEAWGSDAEGETNLPAGLTNVIAIAAGEYHALALIGDGSPAIVRQPWSESIRATGTATFSAGVAGIPPVSLQWALNGTNISGATNAILTVTNVQDPDAGLYTLSATNATGTNVTIGAQLTVIPVTPIITLEPVGQSQFVGTDITLTNSATGSEPLFYQWTLDNTNLPGAAGTSLFLPAAEATNSGDYRVVVTNAYGAVTSVVATVTVVAPGTDGVWLTSVGGSWNVATNWSGGAAASGYDSTANFATLDIASDALVTLDSSPVVGNLVFGDINPDHNWFLDSGTGGPLTLAAITGVTPTITVSNQTATVSTPLAGSSGLLKNGTGTLILTGSNSYSGGTTISAGILQIGAGATNGNLGDGNVTNSSTLTFDRSDNFSVTNNISGPSTAILSHIGTGTLTLSGSNSFAGLAVVTQGTLKAGGSNSFAGNPSITLSNGATLDVNGVNLGAGALTASGAGAGGNGAVVNSGGSQINALQSVTLTGNTTIGGTGPWDDNADPGRWDIRSPNYHTSSTATLSTSGHPYQLTKVGSNHVSLVSVQVDHQLGNIDIQQGKLGFEVLTTSMGNPASNLTVRAGATLSFYQSTNLWNKVFLLNGDGVTATVTNASGANTMTGPITLNGNCVFAVNGTSLTVKGPIVGSGALIKTVGGTLTLSATNTYTGLTTISAGTLMLTPTGSISNSPVITIGAGAAINATSFTIISNQFLQGNGTNLGSVLVKPGGTISPGSNGIGKLFVAGSAILQGTTVMKLNRALGTNDSLQTSSGILGSGTLVVSNFAGTLQVGDTYRLFIPEASSGFTNIIPLAPGPGLAWDRSALTTSGTLRVVASVYPLITNATISNGGMVIKGSGGTAFGPYRVLTSTNAALPLAQWTRTSTNFFDTSGRFTFTNLIAPGVPQLFVALQDMTATAPAARPIPLITNAQRSGNTLVVHGSNGAANATFYVLSSTDATSPLVNWTRSAAHTCDGLGNFAFTNIFLPGASQQFFRVQLP